MTAPAAPAATIAARWRRFGPVGRAAVILLVMVGGLNLVVTGATIVSGGSDPGGPRSSSYATAGNGLAAYADLLVRFHHPVRRIRASLAAAGIDPSSTLVLAEPTRLSRPDMDAATSFVEDGGRLVLTGIEAMPVLARLVGQRDGPRPAEPDFEDDVVVAARPTGGEPEVSGLGAVLTTGFFAWSESGETAPLLELDDDRLVAVAADVGAGRVIALAGTEMLHNQLLARADNAAFGLALAGSAGRPVAFAEFEHGYGGELGVFAIPDRWEWMLAGLTLAVLVWMWSRGKRFGPADQIEPEAVPPRRLYVDAVAALLAKTKQPAVAAEPLRRHAIDRLLARAGRSATAGVSIAAAPADRGAEVREAGAALGLEPGDITTLLRPAADDVELLELGRVAARIGGTKR